MNDIKKAIVYQNQLLYGDDMTNTYPESASKETKIYEEMRCIRCVLERILRVMDEGLFVDYQMEKFGKDYKTE